MLVRYLTHPQIQIEPYIPVPQWSLNATGKARVQALLDQDWLFGTQSIYCSDEIKALETAAPIGRALDIPVIVRTQMAENDRSATGFVLPEMFDDLAGLFFANPDKSIMGWERAVDAQARIIGAFELAMSEVKARGRMGDVLLVGHGGVGTLLYCHLAGLPIDRCYDQKSGGGCYFTYDWVDHSILHSWLPMEETF
ncbi:MAG: phosphoglycerate mutase family protein [Cohaesibacter sp.]|nr:phosphoglycerate mutase family protein [Cohaesibacter sp.]